MKAKAFLFLIATAMLMFVGCKQDVPYLPQHPTDYTAIGYNYCYDGDTEYLGIILEFKDGTKYICYNDHFLNSFCAPDTLKGGVHRIEPKKLCLGIMIIGYNSIVCCQNTMDDMSWIGVPLDEILEVKVGFCD